MAYFLLGLIVAYYLCGVEDTKAIQTKKIKIKGKWYKLTEMD